MFCPQMTRDHTAFPILLTFFHLLKNKKAFVSYETKANLPWYHSNCTTNIIVPLKSLTQIYGSDYIFTRPAPELPSTVLLSAHTYRRLSEKIQVYSSRSLPFKYGNILTKYRLNVKSIKLNTYVFIRQNQFI